MTHRLSAYFIAWICLSIFTLSAWGQEEAAETSIDNPFRELLTPEELGERIAALAERVDESLYLATETRYPRCL